MGQWLKVALDPGNIFFFLYWAQLVYALYAFADAAMASRGAWLYAGKPRGAWLAGLSVAVLASVFLAAGFGFVTIAVITGVSVYLADVRPKLRAYPASRRRL